MFTRWKSKFSHYKTVFESLATTLRDIAKQALVTARATLKLYYRHCRFEFHIAYKKTRAKLKHGLIKALIVAMRNASKLQVAMYANMESCKKYSATLLSVVLALVFFFGVPEHVLHGSDFKASEVHLACAGVIGMALVLVLTLAIIPAQKAADVFSATILKLYARDWETIIVFSALSWTTLISALLGTNWTLDLDRRWTIAVQLILLGLSLDAVKHFYIRAMELLIPETALGLVKQECRNEIARVRKTVDRLTRIHVFETGSQQGLNGIRATFFITSRISLRLRAWIAQLDEFAHKAVSRRDTQAANAIVATMGAIAKEYLDSRADSIQLVPDLSSPAAALSGGVTDASKVSEAVYEAIKAICQDALAAKNELVVRQCLNTLGDMATHAMTITTERLGRLTAPLAFGAIFYLDLCARDVCKTDMEDAQLAAINAIGDVFTKVAADIDSVEAESQALEALYKIALAAYGRQSKVVSEKASEKMFLATRAELNVTGFTVASTFKTALRYARTLVPLEYVMELAGLRGLQPFPPYSQIYDASITNILSDEVGRVQPVEPERDWIDPFQDFKDMSEAIRDHFRDVANDTPSIGGQLLRNIIETIIECARLHIGLLDESPTGCDVYSDTVDEALRSLVYIPQWFFSSRQNFPEREAMDACNSLAVLGMGLMKRQRIETAMACANAIEGIAKNYAASPNVEVYSLADKFMCLEPMARAAGMMSYSVSEADIRAKIACPAPIDAASFSQAIQNRTRLMERTLRESGRGYTLRYDPVFTLRELIEQRRAGMAG